MRAFPHRWLLRLLGAALLIAWAAIGLWQSHKRLPPGLQIAGSWHSVPAGDVRFLSDLTAADATGAPLHQRQINAELLRMIGQARDFLVLDTGLFGDLPAAGPGASRMRAAAPVAAALSDALLQARQLHPELQVLLLIDPTSTRMHPGTAALERLRAAGVAVVPVDLGRLRTPNAAFSSLWQLCCSWWTADDADGDWPNPLGVGSPGVSFGLWGGTPGYQRSHRQLLIADNGAGRLTGLIFSRSLNAEASLHTAVALQLTGGTLEPLLESEFVVAQFSGWIGGGGMQERAQRLFERRRHGATAGIDTASTSTITTTATATAGSTDAARVRVLSEASIEDALLERINAAGSHDSVEIAALYLSQRELVRALIDAAWRGTTVRVLLDPGKDGYGYERSGLPNRQVASELVSASDGAVRVRWYRTHGEQFSPGFVLIRSADRSWLMVGTAELSRRDLDDFDLAAAFIAELSGGATAGSDALSWFDTLWYNRAAGGTEYSSDADVYADASQLDYWQYRLLEASGASFD
jgi:phosphatidylserine/phosphatidylglycerophosphate/cardiolipin synthase-like enzyme